jgi:sec-independent protein translocase protein TatA
MTTPLIAGLGPQELIIIAIVLILLFGAKKLPELARGSGQALRIFKAETKALSDEDKKTQEERDIEARNESADPTVVTPESNEQVPQTQQQAPQPVPPPVQQQPQPVQQPVPQQTEPERRTDTPG